MNTRNLIIAIATAVVVVLAWQTSRENAPTTELRSEKLYPELLDHVNEVARLRIASAKHTAELARVGDDWVVANRDDFPATFATVKNTLLNIADATIVERKTSKPERYAQIGVADITEQGSQATRVDMEKDDGTVLASLLVGNERSGTQLTARQFYVRKADSETALLVEGELNVEDEPSKWMDTDVVDVETSRVREVTIHPADGDEIVVRKQKQSDNFFELADVPEGFTAKSRSIVSSLGAILLDVKFENVAAAAKVEGSSPVSSAVVRTFDGLVVTLERYAHDDDHFVRFRFAFDPDSVVIEPGEEADSESADGSESAAAKEDEPPSPTVADEAAELNEKTAQWIYRLPDYKNRMLEKLLDDMIKPVEDKPAEAE